MRPKKDEVKITGTGSSSSNKIAKKVLKPGSIATQSKTVADKPRNAISFQGGQPSGYRNEPYAKATGQGKKEMASPKKASTKYSPAPMTTAQKNKIKFDAAVKAGRFTGLKRAVGRTSSK